MAPLEEASNLRSITSVPEQSFNPRKCVYYQLALLSRQIDTGKLSAKIEWVYVSQKTYIRGSLRGHNYGEVILSVQIKLIFRHVRD